MKNIFKLIRFAKPYRKIIYFLSVFILITTILDLVSPFIIKLIVDQIDLQLTKHSGSLQRLFVLVGFLFLSSLFSILLEAMNNRLGDYASGRIGKFLTEKFYRKIFTLSQEYFDSQVSGKIVNQLSRGILALQDFLGQASNFIVPAFLRSLFIVIVLAFYSVPIALLVLLLFPFYIYISNYSTKKWGKHQEERNKIEDATRGRIQEVINNIRLVKSFSTQLKEWGLVSENMKKSVEIYDRQSLTYHLLNFVRNFGLETCLIIISIIVFYNTFTGIFTLGVMVLILQYLNQIRWPLFAMSFILEQVQRAEVGSKEYFEILEFKSVENLSSNNTKPKFKNPSIRFKNVSFEYKDSGLVLENISFELSKRETVALVGHSGAGKTTLINLILKFYEPTKGDIFLDNKTYKILSHDDIRSNIALVFQESELFSTTVFDNVAYGKPEASENEVINALKLANAYEFVMKLPKKLHSEIGERGVKLSGGQKQRIQIARAVLADRPILILDEATSSLDAKSEKLVQTALEKLMENRMVIIIAHRFSTIQNANRILVLDSGRLVDSGPPLELAKRKGVYSELLRYQIEGNQKLLEKYELQ